MAEEDYSNVEWLAQIILDRNGQWTDHSRLEQASREQ
jgi:cell division protein FtsL